MPWFAPFRFSPPSRQSHVHVHAHGPAFNPSIEAWLDSVPLPSTKPSSTDLRQWSGHRFYHGLGRSVFVTCAILRAVSLAIALAVTGIIASVVAGGHGLYFVLDRMVPVLVVCPIIVLWNTAEFIAACVLRDGGISPNVHMWADGLVFLGAATATSILLVNIICGIADFGAVYDSAAQEISSACLMIILMIIHSFLLFFFLCNYIDKAAQKQHHQLQLAGIGASFEEEGRHFGADALPFHHLALELRVPENVTPMPPPPPYQAEPVAPAQQQHPELLKSGLTAVSLHLNEFGLANSAGPSGYYSQQHAFAGGSSTRPIQQHRGS